jgi:hypothetical protein
MRLRPRPALRLAAAAALALAACGDEHLVVTPTPLAHPARVSGASPFAAGCTVASRGGVGYPGSEVEPSLAVNPANPDHLVAAWQQDRWSDGGSNGLLAAVSQDRGATWTAVGLPFSLCAGGGGRGGDYQRATDPWVTFSADGSIVHAVGFAFDATTARQAIVASRSSDGGLTWSDPVALASATSADFALDKPTITADPVDPLRVYAVWDRLTGLTSPNPAAATGPAWFARSDDAGLHWTAPTVLYDPGSDAQTISSQVVVLPGGALLDVLVRITAMSSQQPAFDVVALRSTDLGVTWDVPGAVVGALLARGASDPKSGHPIRAGEIVPSTAVDPVTGAVHVAWEDARFSGGAYDGIAHATSTDGGRTWSAPAQVNGAPAAEAFRPAIAAAAGGAVAVSYYDLRTDLADDRDHLWTAFWVATSGDGGATWREAPAGGPFDLRSAPETDDGWFLGDYTGLVASRGGFVALFGMSGDATDLFASP